MEQGPTTTASRSSWPVRILWKAWRALITVLVAASVRGWVRMTSMAVVSGLISVMRRSSVDLSISVGLPRGLDGGSQQKSRLGIGRLARVWSYRWDQIRRAVASAGSG